MTKLVAMIVLAVVAFLFVRYRTSENLQKAVVLGLSFAFFIYIIGVVVMELVR
ncbi:hypothetical protein HGP28_06200 [Vibrio sp. SM6]|uniref:Uncharacterized protein n=1 Tax=Vibrio agarilyticus TaxID=2726741 RepID=A0A7X8YGK0_9VIBR|nr:hypothetical protein [Vibrio agarilyticus]NLS12491.1 hypothetical protein [Vibrio agarilyticus]